eukprot:COSAG06_NODE_58635_length_276_cov_0.898305_1_plen_25_part_10
MAFYRRALRARHGCLCLPRGGARLP